MWRLHLAGATSVIRVLGVSADVVEALRCFAVDDMVAAAHHRVAAEPRWTCLGGSRAQLEVLGDTTIEALRRCGRVPEAQERLATRQARRPTERDQACLGLGRSALVAVEGRPYDAG